MARFLDINVNLCEISSHPPSARSPRFAIARDASCRRSPLKMMIYILPGWSCGLGGVDNGVRRRDTHPLHSGNTEAVNGAGAAGTMVRVAGGGVWCGGYNAAMRIWIARMVATMLALAGLAVVAEECRTAFTRHSMDTIYWSYDRVVAREARLDEWQLWFCSGRVALVIKRARRPLDAPKPTFLVYIDTPRFLPTYHASGGQAVIATPPWLVPATLLAWPVMWSTRSLRRSARRRSRVRRGLCPACGYDTRSSTDRCPECGIMMDKEAATISSASP